jgi:hypothetical protein
MNQQSWVDPRIGRLRADDVKAYLLRQGWKLRDDSGPDLLLFEGPPDDDSVPILQVLPASERMRDFPLRVEELIGAVGVLEGRLRRS